MALLKDYIPAYVRQLVPGSEFRTRWLETLDAVTRRLWDVLLAPILSAVVTDRLILLPGDQLGLLPLHAAWREDRLAFIGRLYALDDVTITYAPSALALRYAQQATSRTAVEVLTGTDDHNTRPTAAGQSTPHGPSKPAVTMSGRTSVPLPAKDAQTPDLARKLISYPWRVAACRSSSSAWVGCRHRTPGMGWPHIP